MGWGAVGAVGAVGAEGALGLTRGRGPGGGGGPEGFLEEMMWRLHLLTRAGWKC